MASEKRPPRLWSYLLLASVFAFLATSLGCINTGQVNPQGYSCGDLTSGHCYCVFNALGGSPPTTTVTLCNPFFGFRTSIYVTNQMSGGNGFIDDEMWLISQTGFSGWIEAGYMTDPQYPTVIEYFWAEDDNSTGVFIKHPLENVPQADIGNYAVVTVSNNGPNLTSSSSFTINIANKATNFSTTTSNALWSSSSGACVAEIQLGQELAGTTGAFAGAVLFINNAWLDQTGVWRWQTDDGGVKSQQPPYAGWIQTPSTADSTGGTFFTECCLPPSGSQAVPRSDAMRRVRRVAASYPTTEAQLPKGIPAVRPTQPNQAPAITPDDVRRFLNSARPPLGTQGATNVSIIRIDCTLTAGG